MAPSTNAIILLACTACLARAQLKGPAWYERNQLVGMGLASNDAQESCTYNPGEFCGFAPGHASGNIQPRCGSCASSCPEANAYACNGAQPAVPFPGAAPSAPWSCMCYRRAAVAGAGLAATSSSSTATSSSSLAITATATGSIDFNGHYQGGNSLIDSIVAKLGVPASTVQQIKVFFASTPASAGQQQQQQGYLRGGLASGGTSLKATTSRRKVSKAQKLPCCGGCAGLVGGCGTWCNYGSCGCNESC